MSGLRSGSGAGRDWSLLPNIPPMLWQPTTPASAARINSLRIVVALCRTPFRTHQLSPRRQAEGRFDPAGCENFAGGPSAQPAKAAQITWSAQDLRLNLIGSGFSPTLDITIEFASSNAIESNFFSVFASPFPSLAPPSPAKGFSVSVSTVTVLPSSFTTFQVPVNASWSFSDGPPMANRKPLSALNSTVNGPSFAPSPSGLPSQTPTSFFAYVSSPGLPGPDVALLSQPADKTATPSNIPANRHDVNMIGLLV